MPTLWEFTPKRTNLEERGHGTNQYYSENQLPTLAEFLNHGGSQPVVKKVGKKTCLSRPEARRGSQMPCQDRGGCGPSPAGVPLRPHQQAIGCIPLRGYVVRNWPSSCRYFNSSLMKKSYSSHVLNLEHRTRKKGY